MQPVSADAAGSFPPGGGQSGFALEFVSLLGGLWRWFKMFDPFKRDV